MDIERYDGSKERREYGSIKDMMKDAEKESQSPGTKKLTLHFPNMRIPGRRSLRDVLKRKEIAMVK